MRLTTIDVWGGLVIALMLIAFMAVCARGAWLSYHDQAYSADDWHYLTFLSVDCGIVAVAIIGILLRFK